MRTATESRSIELLVRGVCVYRRQLLVCRNRRKGNLYLPGGHVHWGESVKSALRREIAEELGWRIPVGRFLGVCEHTFYQQGRKVCEINFCFEVKCPRQYLGVLPTSREPQLEFCWVPLRHVRKSGLLPAALREVLCSWLSVRHSARLWVSNYDD